MRVFGILGMAVLAGSPAIPVQLISTFITPMGMALPSPVSRSNRANRFAKPIEPALVSLKPWTKDVRQQVETWLPMVQVTTTPSKAQLKTEGSASVTQAAEDQCSTDLLAQSAAAPQRGYHVEVRGATVAVLPTRQQADRLAAQLKPMFDREGFVPEQVYPAVIDQHAGAKMGDRVLFTVDPSTAKALRQSADLVAIQWVNGIRQAFEMPPLPLAEAQEHLYGLVPTKRTLEGIASWYGPYFHGRLTATGETFDQKELTAAHPSLPFDTYLKVTNVISGGSVIVRINDRGPYVGRRSLDLSRAAARCIGGEQRGVVPYEAVILTQAKTAQTEPSDNLVAQLTKPTDTP